MGLAKGTGGIPPIMGGPITGEKSGIAPYSGAGTDRETRTAPGVSI